MLVIHGPWLKNSKNYVGSCFAHARFYSMSIADAVASTPSRIAILHGSHSGNTERLAKQLHAEFRWRLGESALIGSTGHYDFRSLGQLTKDDLVLLLVSTYGDGGPNQSSHHLWDTVFDSRAPVLDFGYSVLARGSSLYGKNFAMAGRKFDDRLAELGAHRVAPIGIHDKIGLDPDEDFFNWKEQVIQYAIKTRAYTERAYKYEPTVEVAEVPSFGGAVTEVFYQNAESPGLSPIEMRVSASQLASTDRDYVFAQAELPAGDHYKTGDYLAIWPENPKSETEIFLDALFGSSERRYNAIRVNNGSREVTTSYELLASHSLDINGRVERDLLLKLANFAPSEEAKQRTLALMRDKAQLQDVSDVQCNYNLARLLKWLSPDDPWISRLPPSTLFDVLPHLLPRRYSISSSSIEEPQYASLSAVVERDAHTGFQGVATGQLYSLIGRPGKSIMAAVEPLSTFRPPSDPSTPLLMFAVGTGVAPFRAFIRERALSGKDSGPTVLFAGSRTPDDLVHHKELRDLEADPDFDFTLVPAYSRVEDTHPNKGYIFEQLARHGDLVWEMLQQGAEVYICGDIRKIRRGVRDGLAEVLAAKKGLPPQLGQREFKKLKRAGRIHLDLW